MEKSKTISQPLFLAVLISSFLLSIPLIAMQFDTGVNWSFSDFLIMGVLIFLTAYAFLFLNRKGSNLKIKIAFAMSIGITFLLIWANLAVGLIGSGPNVGNLMYIAVVAVSVIGSFYVKFNPKGMQRVMYTTAAAILLLAMIAIAMGMSNLPGSSVAEILMVNGFFAVGYVITGYIFGHVSRTTKLPA